MNIVSYISKKKKSSIKTNTEVKAVSEEGTDSNLKALESISHRLIFQLNAKKKKSIMP